MTGGYHALAYTDVALAALFLVLNGALSIWLGLGLGRRLAVAALRMVAQLLAVGLVLRTLFAVASPWWTLALALVMAAFAGREVWARQDRPLAGLWGLSLGAGAMTLAGAVVTLVALAALIRPEPWWQSRYAIPLFGMILGNAMTGVSLALDRLTTDCHRGRVAIEAQLLLGATRWQALRPNAQAALRAGLMPTINAMAATGVVALPGMMTGQILSGVDPAEAVKYQLLVMFLIGGATGLGVLGAVMGAARRLTDERHRLRLDRLAPKP